MGKMCNFKVNIIIPTYNNRECIERVTRDIISKTTCSYELLIIDNHSTDPAVLEYLSDIGSKDNIHVITLPENVYYWPAVNAGIKNADRKNKYTLVMNDDVVIVSDEWIQKMVKVVESDDKIAYVGDLMKRPNCPPFGGWIDGWCMLFKTEIFETVGLFDESFVWWYSDADYSVRTYKHGYTVKDIKKQGDKHCKIRGVIYHLRGKTLRRGKSLKMFETQKTDIPLEKLMPSDFRYHKLLLKHKLLRLYVWCLLGSIFGQVGRKMETMITKRAKI